MKKAAAQTERLNKLIRSAKSNPPPESFKPDSWCKPHRPNQNAVFAAAASADYLRIDARKFVGTLRQTKFAGDIVLAVLPDSTDSFLSALKTYDNIIVYTLQMDCTKSGNGAEPKCAFKGSNEHFSVNMMRYYLYQWWAQEYSDESLILVSDFRDVIFQSDPFKYRTFEWAPPVAQLTVFLEAYPTKFIYRCCCTYVREWMWM